MLFPLHKRKVICDAACHVAGGRGVACDYEAAIGTPIESPCYGTIYHFHDEEGGDWIGIKRDDGYKFEFAHLSEYLVADGSKVSPGQKIALSGNSGTLTSGPHAHHQILDNLGNRIDPEEFYFAKNIPVMAINTTIPFMKSLQDEIIKYSQGMLTISWDIINHPLYVGQGMLTQAEAYDIAKQLYDDRYKPYRYLFMFYKGNSTSSFLATYYDPAGRCITTAPLPSDPMACSFEFSHQIQNWYNTHRGELPPIEVVDSNFPTEDLIISKYRSVLPHVDILLQS